MKFFSPLRKALFLGLVALLSSSTKSQAQCANANTFLSNYTPVCDGIAHQATACIKGGQYVAVDVVAGNVYIFSTCGNTAFDTQITIYNSTGGSALGYNDDFCSLQSQVSWTATFTGTLWVLVNQYSCTTNSTCIPLNVTCSAPPPPPTADSACLSPVPDDCANACNLGTLPAPAACVTGQATAIGGHFPAHWDPKLRIPRGQVVAAASIVSPKY